MRWMAAVMRRTSAGFSAAAMLRSLVEAPLPRNRPPPPSRILPATPSHRLAQQGDFRRHFVRKQSSFQHHSADMMRVRARARGGGGGGGGAHVAGVSCSEGWPELRNRTLMDDSYVNRRFKNERV